MSTVQQCCANKPKYLITYSCGPEPEETLLVCQGHFDSDECFRRFAIKTEVLN